LQRVTHDWNGHPSFTPNFLRANRQDAKDAKEGEDWVRFLVFFLISWRSWRLGGRFFGLRKILHSADF
jgi:hypothetical protein